MKTIKEINQAIKDFKKDAYCRNCGNSDRYLDGAIWALEWVKE